MDLKFLFKVCLCIIQLICVYRVLRHNDCYLVPVQLFITVIMMI